MPGICYETLRVHCDQKRKADRGNCEALGEVQSGDWVFYLKCPIRLVLHRAADRTLSTIIRHMFLEIQLPPDDLSKIIIP